MIYRVDSRCSQSCIVPDSYLQPIVCVVHDNTTKMWGRWKVVMVLLRNFIGNQLRHSPFQHKTKFWVVPFHSFLRFRSLLRTSNYTRLLHAYRKPWHLLSLVVLRIKLAAHYLLYNCRLCYAQCCACTQPESHSTFVDFLFSSKLKDYNLCGLNNSREICYCGAGGSCRFNLSQQGPCLLCWNGV